MSRLTDFGRNVACYFGLAEGTPLTTEADDERLWVEMLHLAEDREAAELWLARKGYSRARLEEITADEVGADAIEGRAAA